MTCPYSDCSITGAHSHGVGTALVEYGHPSSLPDAIEQIRAERDILRRRVEERAHDCASVEAERDRLKEEVRVLELQYEAAAALDKMDSEDYEKQIERLTRNLAERDDAVDRLYDAWSLPEGKHQDPSGCPTWYDYCHCTAEVLAEQIARAEKAERALAEREAVCQAHMEMRYNAERERDRLRDELAEIKKVLIGYYCQVGVGIMSVRKLAKRLHDEQTAGGTRLPAEIPADYPDGSFSPSGIFSDEAKP